MVATPFNIYDIASDPTKGLPGMPPAFGRYTLPHALTFSGLISSISRVYRASDEALKDSFENARLMTNDPVVEECTEIRRQACCLFDWHLEPGDKHDTEQADVCTQLTKMIESIPRFIQYRESLLRATWLGKSAVEHRWGWKRIGNKMRLMPVEWVPLHGDKIVFRYDDGRGDYRPDQIGIRVGFPAMRWRKEFEKWRKTTAYWERDPLLKRIHESIVTSRMGKIQPTDYGLAYFLDSWERPLLAIHKHQIEDGEYEEPTNAGRLHGKGIRSVIYWAWMQKQAALSLLMEYLERSAFGFNVAYYPAHNPQAANEIKEAVLRQSESGGSRNLIFFPVWQDEQAQNYQIQHIEPGIGGVEALKMIIQDYFGHLIKRYILGQTLTSEAGSTGLGSELARVHLGTFMQKVRYDAKLEQETITTDLVNLLIQYNFPEHTHSGIRFVIDTESEDAEAKLAAFEKAYNMGLIIKAQDVRDVVGASKPEIDDETLDMAATQKAMQPPMPYGMPGIDTGPIGQVGHTPDATPLEQESYTPGQTVATDRTPMIRTNDERPKPSDKAVMSELTRQLANEFGRRRGGMISYASSGGNCGTGAGGFKPGNTCATGNGGGGSDLSNLRLPGMGGGIAANYKDKLWDMAQKKDPFLKKGAIPEQAIGMASERGLLKNRQDMDKLIDSMNRYGHTKDGAIKALNELANPQASKPANSLPDFNSESVSAIMKKHGGDEGKVMQTIGMAIDMAHSQGKYPVFEYTDVGGSTQQIAIDRNLRDSSGAMWHPKWIESGQGSIRFYDSSTAEYK